MGSSKYPALAPAMEDAFWQELADENPGLGLTITAQDARDWFGLYAWLRYKTKPWAYSRDMRTHRNKILMWWSWTQGYEIVEARFRRAVAEGRCKPRRYSPPRPGTREMPQEPRYVRPEGPPERRPSAVGTILRAVK